MSSYPVMDDAIYYASQHVTDLGSKDSAEYMTGVYVMPDGTYGVAAPIGGKSKSKVGGKLRYPKAAKLVALVHNHPEAKSTGTARDGNADQFSSDDIKQAKDLGIPSYIAHGKGMNISGWNPQTTQGRQKHGVPFSHIPEVQPAGRYLARAVNALLGAAK